MRSGSNRLEAFRKSMEAVRDWFWYAESGLNRKIDAVMNIKQVFILGIDPEDAPHAELAVIPLKEVAYPESIRLEDIRYGVAEGFHHGVVGFFRSLFAESAVGLIEGGAAGIIETAGQGRAARGSHNQRCACRGTFQHLAPSKVVFGRVHVSPLNVLSDYLVTTTVWPMDDGTGSG